MDQPTSPVSKPQISPGQGVAYFLSAVAFAFLVFLFFRRIWGWMPDWGQVAVLVAGPVLALVCTELAARRERTGYVALLCAVAAFACLVIDVFLLTQTFNLIPSPGQFLAWGAFGLLLGYAYGLDLALVAGGASLVIWATAQTATGNIDWRDAPRPEGILPALVLFTVLLLLYLRRSLQDRARLAASYRRWRLPAGLAIIALINGLILGRAIWSRSGNADRFVLTERELALQSWGRAGSGVTLGFVPNLADEWDETSLRRLGFDVEEARRHPDRVPLRDGFAVFEMDGEPWCRWLRARLAEQSEREKRKATGELERLEISRLLPVDVGLDAQELRRRYPERSRFLILPVAASPAVNSNPYGVKAALELRVPRIHVPLELRPVLDQVRREEEAYRAKGYQPHGPRYQAVLAVVPGREPWLVSVERLPAPTAAARPAPPDACPG
ncbi:MAG: DUF4824 family protein [Acidobacteriota bacterium]